MGGALAGIAFIFFVLAGTVLFVWKSSDRAWRLVRNIVVGAGILGFSLPLIYMQKRNEPIESDRLLVTSSDLGIKWPFHQFTSGILRCEVHRFEDGRVRPAVSILLGGTEFGLNAPGLQLYADPRPMQERDPATGTILQTSDALIERGLRLCPWD